MNKNLPVEDYLTNLPADVQAITRALVAMARKNMPSSYEIIYHNAVGYSMTASPFDRICYIAPQKKGYVNFGFFFGANLPDPEQLLEGKGKRMRHVKVRSMQEAANPALEKLIIATWQEAPDSIAKIHSRQ